MQSGRTERRWGSVRLSVCPRVRLNFSRKSSSGTSAFLRAGGWGGTAVPAPRGCGAQVAGGAGALAVLNALKELRRDLGHGTGWGGRGWDSPPCGGKQILACGDLQG